MGRLQHLLSCFSVNCCFVCIVGVAAAALFALTRPAPNQAIIDAVKQRQYQRLHALVTDKLAEEGAQQRVSDMLVPSSSSSSASASASPIDLLDFGGGRTALHVAAMHGDAAILKYFHLHHGAALDATKDHDQRTPLHLAATFNQVDVVRLLIQWGAKVDARALHGWTPLLKAVLLSNHDNVEALLEAGANPNAAVDDSFNALQCSFIYSNIRMSALLIRFGAYIEEGENYRADYVTLRDQLSQSSLLKPDVIERRKFQTHTETAADTDDEPAASPYENPSPASPAATLYDSSLYRADDSQPSLKS